MLDTLAHNFWQCLQQQEQSAAMHWHADKHQEIKHTSALRHHHVNHSAKVDHALMNSHLV
jgi:hypothetical protein